MEKYEEPIIDVIRIKSEQVLTESNGDRETGKDDEDGVFGGE